MYSVSSQARQHPPATRAAALPRERLAPSELWLPAALALTAGALLAASLAVIGVPSWLSLSLGLLAAIRVVVWGAGAASLRRR